MSAKALNLPYENVKYFGIEIQTNTPTYYPLECALVSQLAYLVGENVLFDSTLNANNNFREQFISLTSEKEFYKIQKNIDILMETQEKLVQLYSTLNDFQASELSVEKATKEIEIQKTKVKTLFLETQKLILTGYFDNMINIAYSPKFLENYRNKLYLFKNLIGWADGDTFYNDYYIDKMNEIEKRYEYTPNTELSLAIIKPSLISRILKKLKVLFGLNKEYQRER